MDVADFQGMLDRLRNRYYLNVNSLVSKTSTFHALNNIFMSTGRASPTSFQSNAFYRRYREFLYATTAVGVTTSSRRPQPKLLNKARLAKVGGHYTSWTTKHGKTVTRYFFEGQPGAWGLAKAAVIYRTRVLRL